jgi:hypothetical protein
MTAKEDEYVVIVEQNVGALHATPLRETRHGG